MDKIAMYGGAFDPPHNGHVHIAKAFAKILDPVQLLVIPTAESPHKDRIGGASPYQRLEMCRLAMHGIPNVSVSDMEISRGGKSYTVDTLTVLANIYPGSQLFLLMGADMFLTLREWYQYEKLISLATICPVARDSFDMETLRNQAISLNARVLLENIGVYHISSTQVRERLRNGEAVNELIPSYVEDYIREKRLYL